jgi:hypothetical protein
MVFIFQKKKEKKKGKGKEKLMKRVHPAQLFVRVYVAKAARQAQIV